MVPKIRNIIIFVIIAAIFVLIFIFYLNSSSDKGSLVSTPSNASSPNTNNTGAKTSVVPDQASLDAKDFLTLLLNVKSIQLDDVILSEPAFNGLHDSSITLTPDGTEGRPNPFAQFGAENSSIPTTPASGATLPISASPTSGSSGLTPAKP